MARVLIIDDDVTLRQALTKHLERAGHDVRRDTRRIARCRRARDGARRRPLSQQAVRGRRAGDAGRHVARADGRAGAL